MNELPCISIGAGNAVKKGNAVGVQIHVWLDRPSPDPVKIDYVGMLEYSAWGQKWWYGESFGTLHLAPNQTSTYVNLIQVNPAPSAAGPAKMISGHQVYTVQLVSAVGAIPGCTLGHAIIKGSTPPLYVIYGPNVDGVYALEPNPDVTPDGVGDLVMEINGWRLFEYTLPSGAEEFKYSICTSNANADYVGLLRKDKDDLSWYAAGRGGEYILDDNGDKIVCEEDVCAIWFAEGELYSLFYEPDYSFEDGDAINWGYSINKLANGHGSTVFLGSEGAYQMAIGKNLSSDGTTFTFEGVQGQWLNDD